VETNGPGRVKCGGCGADAVGGDLCAECGRLQPFPPGADHWVVLGLPRRLVLERGDLEARFHELNRRSHPDYFRLRSPGEQAGSLENSAAVNSAYRALRAPVSRVEYLLEAEGMALSSAGQGEPPAELFEEILELQEARQELATAGPDEAPPLRARLLVAKAEFERRREETEIELTALFPRWDASTEPERQGLLPRMRDVLARRAYLRTLLRDLDATLGGDGRTDGEAT